LHDGELERFWYYTDKAGSAGKSKDAIRLVVGKNDREQNSVERLARLQIVFESVFEWAAPDYAGIENYAIRAEQGAHYLGEVGGLARLTAFRKGIPLRLHDPISVKMFVAHAGNAKGKTIVEKKVAERWGVHFSDFNQPPPKPTKKVAKPKRNRQTSEDLADAFSVAKLVELEAALRLGEVELRSLHEKEIQVFNRCTKTYPRSLLDRNWITAPGHEELRAMWEGVDDASFHLRDLEIPI
jgi:Holliday junction resolvasome RuvABC endonuclease subunit